MPNSELVLFVVVIIPYIPKKFNHLIPFCFFPISSLFPPIECNSLVVCEALIEEAAALFYFIQYNSVKSSININDRVKL